MSPRYVLSAVLVAALASCYLSGLHLRPGSYRLTRVALEDGCADIQGEAASIDLAYLGGRLGDWGCSNADGALWCSGIVHVAAGACTVRVYRSLRFSQRLNGRLVLGDWLDTWEPDYECGIEACTISGAAMLEMRY